MAFFSVRHDVLLPDDFVERLRAIFAGENRVAHAETLDAGRPRRRLQTAVSPRQQLFPNSAIGNRAAAVFLCAHARQSHRPGNQGAHRRAEFHRAARGFCGLVAGRCRRSASPICRRMSRPSFSACCRTRRRRRCSSISIPMRSTIVLKAMGHAEAARILNDMSPDDRTALLEELPGAAVAQMLQLLSPEEKAIAQSLLNYPEDSVGRLMTPDFISVREDWTIQQVLDHIREHGQRFRDAERDLRDRRARAADRRRAHPRDSARARWRRRSPTSTTAHFVALRATDDAERRRSSFSKNTTATRCR